MSTPKQSDELYQLEGKCSLRRVLPYPLQQILAMFVTNVTPLTIITSAAVSFLPHETVLNLIQGAMVAAGIATFVQATPIWKIGSGLPIFTGLSFTFVIPLSAIAAAYGYPAVIGGIMLMVLGQILVSGMEMIAKAGFTPRNRLIVALSLSSAIGFTASTEVGIWYSLPTSIQTIFSQNVVAVVFVTAMLLNLLLPKEI